MCSFFFVGGGGLNCHLIPCVSSLAAPPLGLDVWSKPYHDTQQCSVHMRGSHHLLESRCACFRCFFHSPGQPESLHWALPLKHILPISANVTDFTRNDHVTIVFTLNRRSMDLDALLDYSNQALLMNMYPVKMFMSTSSNCVKSFKSSGSIGLLIQRIFHFCIK